MLQLRTSHAQDLPRLKELWKLAFGDEDSYIDHFFTRYYTPERMLVLEQDGVVRAMTAWFDMPLVFSDGTPTPSAYLYAVATHPDCRGRGLAGQLLSFADQWLAEHGFTSVTTVPARPDLHDFFGQNGFQECFSLRQKNDVPKPNADSVLMEKIDAMRYGVLREHLLQGTDHISYSPAALDYQAGVCALSGGGLYQFGSVGCACVELAGDEVFIKELLCSDSMYKNALASIAQQHPARHYWVRTPDRGQGENWNFAMLKWLTTPPTWQKKTPPYLGLAFD